MIIDESFNMKYGGFSVIFLESINKSVIYFYSDGNGDWAHGEGKIIVLRKLGENFETMKNLNLDFYLPQ